VTPAGEQLDKVLAAAIAESRGAQIAIAHKILGVTDMATPVVGIGAIVRDAKASMATARASVERLKKNVDDLAETIKQVDTMADEVKTAHNELTGEIHGVTNGPPSE
jgi:prefoldin subunit 5